MNHILGQGIPYTDFNEVMFKRGTVNRQAATAFNLARIQVPNPELGIGTDIEFMGNVGNPYLGTLGSQPDIYYYEPDNIEYLPNDFSGNPTDNIDGSGFYLGSALMGTGVMG